MTEFTSEEIANMSIRDRVMLGIYTDPNNVNSSELVEKRVSEAKSIDETEGTSIRAAVELGFGGSPLSRKLSHYRNSEKSKGKE